MPTHQSISGMSDTELVERMVTSHDERHDHAFRSYFDTHVSPNLPGRPTIVDLGCGPGLFLRDLSRRFPGSALHGYDLTPAMITYAQEEVTYAGPKPTLAGHDLTAQPVPLADSSVHLINMTAILHLLDEPLPVLVEIRRLLAPEGIFFLNDWVRAPLTEYLDSRVEGEGAERQDSLRRWFRLFPVHNKYTTEDWQWLLAEAGFAIRETASLRANFRVFVTTPIAA
jgi:SAM-dependent methyltransferase